MEEIFGVKTEYDNGWLGGAIDARNLCTLAWDTEESCLKSKEIDSLLYFNILLPTIDLPFLIPIWIIPLRSKYKQGLLWMVDLYGLHYRLR